MFSVFEQKSRESPSPSPEPLSDLLGTQLFTDVRIALSIAFWRKRISLSRAKGTRDYGRNANQLYHSLLPRRMMRDGRRTGRGGRRPYCANDRLIVAFRNATRGMPRLVGFLSHRRAFRTLRRLASPLVMAVATQKDAFAVSPI